MTILYLAIGAGALALAFALALALNILKQDPGSETVRSIVRAIQDGANAFLAREYLMLGVFVIAMFAILAIFIDYDVTDKVGNDRDIPSTAIAYLAGAIGSALAGYIGMSIAGRANTRTISEIMKGRTNSRITLCCAVWGSRRRTNTAIGKPMAKAITTAMAEWIME